MTLGASRPAADCLPDHGDLHGGETRSHYGRSLGYGEGRKRPRPPRPPNGAPLTNRLRCYGKIGVWARDGGESAWRTNDEEFVLELVTPPNTTATVYAPMWAQQEVTESGKPIAPAEGVAVLRRDDGAAACAVASGSYRFVAKSREWSRPAVTSSGDRFPTRLALRRGIEFLRQDRRREMPPG